MWIWLHLTDDKSTLVQVMTWCPQAASHYLSKCRPRSMSTNGVTRPQWVNKPFIMPPPLGAGGIMFSGCPSVRPKPEIPSFDLYMGPLVHPTNRNRFTACPSVRPSVRRGFRAFAGKIHGGNGLKFYMLMYLDHLQNWLVYGRGLLFFLILALFWLNETGQIWGFRAFAGERLEEMAWNFARWCILTTFRTD